MLAHSPKIVLNGLTLCLDAANRKSYNAGISTTTWTDLSGRGNHFTIDASGFTHNSSGYFSMSGIGGIFRNGSITSSTTCTCVFWIKTQDVQSLFWSKTTSADGYLGAYSINDKFYNNTAGTPTFFMDTITKANIYDNIRDNQWHMIEFKSVNLSSWSSFNFSRYSNYFFGDGNISYISIYDRNLTENESKQNYTALKSRFGLT